jgi:myo-inositol-1-phosphate synthase
MATIKIAIAGVGNCASSLVQGLEYYRHRPDSDVIGVMHPEIGDYRARDIHVVAAFDIDERKVGKPLEEAIFAKPNCTTVFQSALPLSGVTVEMAPVLDGVADHMADYEDDQAFRVADEKPVDIAARLKESGAEVLLCYLPVGSEAAVRHYAEACLEAGVAMVNCVPVFIASDPEWAMRFHEAGVPIVGDDIKSQVGATIVHRSLARLFSDRGVALDRTYQLNTGGNTDFLNMLERKRLSSKKKSKTQSVQSQLDTPMAARDIHIGPSDYVPWQGDNKVCFIRMEGRGFGDVPLELEMRLSVQDSPNSAGVVIDALRCAKLALDRGIGGPLEAPSAYFMKSPPVQMRDSVAHDLCNGFIEGEVATASNIDWYREPEVAAQGKGRSTAKSPVTALILAAGYGSRLFPGASLPKPLAPVQGRTLAEWVVRTLQEGAGVNRFVVSLGHEAETVRGHFNSVAKRVGVEIDYVRATDWKSGNGASALAAAEMLADTPFLISMCDHLFDPALAAALVAAGPPKDGLLLAADFDKRSIPDLDDLTKVSLRDGAITAIGKDLVKWDAGDTGVMYATPSLFLALAEAQAQGRHGLSDGLRVLAEQGRARVVDVSGQWWLDVDTLEMLQMAEKHYQNGVRLTG